MQVIPTKETSRCKGTEVRQYDDFEYEFSVGEVRGRKVKVMCSKTVVVCVPCVREKI